MTKKWATYFLFAVLGAFALLFALNLVGFGPALVKYERVRVILPPQKKAAQPAPTPPAVRKVAPAKKAVAKPAPAPAVPPAPASQSVDVNINIRVRGEELPYRHVQTATCPKVGYYVLSHEPTTDSRQFDDRGNWNPGHMELVRECRNGALVEFPRWVGHHLPSAPAPNPPYPYYIPRYPPQVP